MPEEPNMSYKLRWTQDYIEWQAFVEEIIEMKVEASGCVDAKAVIAYIKSL